MGVFRGRRIRSGIDMVDYIVVEIYVDVVDWGCLVGGAWVGVLGRGRGLGLGLGVGG
jgi:hypothetical protein